MFQTTNHVKFQTRFLASMAWLQTRQVIDDFDALGPIQESGHLFSGSMKYQQQRMNENFTRNYVLPFGFGWVSSGFNDNAIWNGIYPITMCSGPWNQGTVPYFGQCFVVIVPHMALTWALLMVGTSNFWYWIVPFNGNLENTQQVYTLEIEFANGAWHICRWYMQTKGTKKGIPFNPIAIFYCHGMYLNASGQFHVWS